MATRADFPDDILVEIFSRLPAKSIGKLRSLSKPWRKSLSSPQFIKSHLSRQKSRHQQQQNLLLVPWDGSPFFRVVETINDDDSTVSRELDFRAGIGCHPVITLNDDDSTVCREIDFPADIGCHPVITCDGLILLTIDLMNIFLANPITLELVKIPNPPFEGEGEYPPEEGVDISSTYGLGHDTVNDDYKISLVSYHDLDSCSYDDDHLLNVDVYSVKMGVWKRIESPPDRYTWPSPWPGPSVNGAMHWLAGRNNRHGLIVALDIANEVCFEIPAPSDVDVKSSCLEVLGMCLCLIDYPRNNTRRGTGTDVWIMKEYGVADSWTKLFTVPRSGSNPVTVTPLCFIRDEEEVVLIKDEHHLVVHNVKEGTSRNLVVDGVLGEFVTGWTFVGSLVSPTALWCHNGEQTSE